MFQDGVAKAFFGETTLERSSASLCKSLWREIYPASFAYHLVAKSASSPRTPGARALHVTTLPMWPPSPAARPRSCR